MTENSTMAQKHEETASQDLAVEKYRRAFLVALIAFIAGAGIAALLWWRSPFNSMAHGSQFTVTTSVGSETSQSTTDSTASAGGPTAPQLDSPLAPIQLSPQRMQSIGVKVGTVESKVMNDEIRSYGNVQARSEE